MPDTLEALGVFLLAVLPGGLYIWAVERDVGRWGVNLTDRILRFVAVSAIFQVLFAAPLYFLRREFWHHEIAGRAGHFENRIADGDALPFWLFLVPILYLGIPILAGIVVARIARGTSEASNVAARVLVGRDPEPRAWDHLFWQRPTGVVRMRLKNDDGHPWVGGFYGKHSYASGYPEASQDLWLERSYVMNDDGTFVAKETENREREYVETGAGLLIRWEEIDLLEFFHVEPAEDENGQQE
jgi:hypothetical protein